VDQVRIWWGNYHFLGLTSYVLAVKLKALRNDLKKWNKETFDNVAARKSVLLDEIWHLDRREEQGFFNGSDRAASLPGRRKKKSGNYKSYLLWRE
jgi:hypothetical protein